MMIKNYICINHLKNTAERFKFQFACGIFNWTRASCAENSATCDGFFDASFHDLTGYGVITLTVADTETLGSVVLY